MQCKAGKNSDVAIQASLADDPVLSPWIIFFSQ